MSWGNPASHRSSDGALASTPTIRVVACARSFRMHEINTKPYLLPWRRAGTGLPRTARLSRVSRSPMFNTVDQKRCAPAKSLLEALCLSLRFQLQFPEADIQRWIPLRKRSDCCPGEPSEQATELSQLRIRLDAAAALPVARSQRSSRRSSDRLQPLEFPKH
jgi:hypothetical protein